MVFVRGWLRAMGEKSLCGGVPKAAKDSRFD